ncbi:hypothetical protein BJ322DRAFT_828370 [Thelephora terrestris]|uniref:BTB domain-containing protein n=1 Tax=Thelephora terrestris TaxID=56493 RepID=A0A9P6HED9_9AGAM|nr:hypothetical protein BJ322DRAFT_828370 [Thelephora terrestris]
MVTTVALREALNEGISSGSFIDTKIILYSYRDFSGRVCRPKALYANSHVLKTVPYFNDLLFGDFAESQSKEFEEAIDEDGSTEDYEYLSDSDLEDDEDEKILSGMESTPHTLDAPASVGEEKAVPEDYRERIEKGKVVKIPDIAFLTFQAFLVYLYTSKIWFAPFGSEENRRSRSVEIIDPGTFPRASPKSIYRLADKYDVPELKALALNHIRHQLTKCDIVEETFSRFASRFDEVRSLYLEQLALVWMEDSKTEVTRASVDQKIDSFVEGGLEHASETIVALLEIASKDDDIGSPVNTSPDDTPDSCWTSVEEAFLISIREGVFFDRKYLARHYKAGDLFKPVYFSGKIMDDKAQQLKKLVKYFKGRNPPVDDLGVDATVESDCEGDSQGTESEPLNEEKTRAFLTTGSFSAYVDSHAVPLSHEK